MRPAVIFTLVLSLVELGMGPLSSCALFSSKLAECATPETQLQCAQMNMDESDLQLVPASDTSCCSISQAPIPQPQFKGSDVSLAAPSVILTPADDTPRVHSLLPDPIAPDTSPPRLQSLLCIFLI